MIRTINHNDRDCYIEMASQFYATDAVLKPIPRSYIERTFDELMHSSPYVDAYIFECDNETAGYALLAKTFSQEAGGMVCWIEELYVLPSFRNRNLGKEFLEYLKRNRMAECTRFRLEVEDTNPGAIRLYERMGFSFLEYMQMYIDFPKEI